MRADSIRDKHLFFPDLPLLHLVHPAFSEDQVFLTKQTASLMAVTWELLFSAGLSIVRLRALALLKDPRLLQAMSLLPPRQVNPLSRVFLDLDQI
jgi:hypothetical protein